MRESPLPIPPTLPPRRIVVIGGGVMGAWAALQRGSPVGPCCCSTPMASGTRERAPATTRGSSAAATATTRSTRAGPARRARCGRRSEEERVELFVQAGTLWFAGESGFEADSEATLRGLDIPVEHLSTDEVVLDGPASGRLAWALSRAGGRAAPRTARGRGRASGASGRRGPSDRARCAPAAPTATGARRRRARAADRRRDVRLRVRTLAAGASSRTRRRPVRVTKQSVHYLGPAPGDGRWMAPRFPTWVDYEPTFYGIGAVRHDRRQGRATVRARRSTPRGRTGSSTRRPCRRPRLLPHPVPGPGRGARRRDARLPVRDDRRRHFLIDRHPSFGDVWLVGGGSGHGFKHGPVIGAHVVGRLDGAPPWGRPLRARAARRGRGHYRIGGDGLVAAWEATVHESDAGLDAVAADDREAPARVPRPDPGADRRGNGRPRDDDRRAHALGRGNRAGPTDSSRSPSRDSGAQAMA